MGVIPCFDICLFHYLVINFVIDVIISRFGIDKNNLSGVKWLGLLSPGYSYRRFVISVDIFLLIKYNSVQ